MLVLSRKLHERIGIGDNIVVTVHLLKSDRVQLAIEAPGLLVLRDDAGPDVGKGLQSGRLVLSRRMHQSISIGDDVTITIERLTATRVSIGTEAPSTVRIVRLPPLDTPPPDDTGSPKTLSLPAQKPAKQRIAIGSQRRIAS